MKQGKGDRLEFPGQGRVKKLGNYSFVPFGFNKLHALRSALSQFLHSSLSPSFRKVAVLAYLSPPSPERRLESIA
jgi:hypothetical protein